MDRNYIRDLKRNGADVEGALERFMGNEDVHQKFLEKTVQSSYLADMEKSLEEGACQEAFRHAHSLKGVAANMGLVPIQQAASELTELLRGRESAEEVDMAAVEEKKRAMEDAFQAFLEIVHAYQ